MHFSPSAAAIKHLRGPRCDWGPLMEILRTHVYLSPFEVLRITSKVHGWHKAIPPDALQAELALRNNEVGSRVDPEPILDDVTPQVERFVPPPPEVKAQIDAFLGSAGKKAQRETGPVLGPGRLSPEDQDKRERDIQRLIKQYANPSLLEDPSTKVG